MLRTSLHFDEYGNLKPYESIEVDLATLKAYFVTRFPNSTTRKRLFENYERYLYRFQDKVFPIFEQWINGSFVIQKENPNDIDIITFLDYEVYEKRRDKVLDKFWSFSLEDEGIDSYLVKDYPEGHIFYDKTLEWKETWLRRYSNIDNVDNNKGFLKIYFEK